MHTAWLETWDSAISWKIRSFTTNSQATVPTHTRKRGCTVGVLMISEEETAVVFNGGVELIRPCVKRGFEDIT